MEERSGCGVVAFPPGVAELGFDPLTTDDSPPSSPSSLPPSYFDEVYRRNPDPWAFATSPYEASKYAATLDALPKSTYPEAFEAGCSIGVLTEKLARRCGHLLSVDVSEAALQQARERCAELENVRFERCHLPAEFPPARFDLILVSEVGYYLSVPDLLRLRERCINQLTAGGHLLLVHWTPVVHDYPLTGDYVHETFLERVGRRFAISRDNVRNAIGWIFSKNRERTHSRGHPVTCEAATQVNVDLFDLRGRQNRVTDSLPGLLLGDRFVQRAERRG